MFPRPRPTRLPPGSDLFDEDEFGVNFGLPLPRGHGPGLEGLLSGRGGHIDDFDNLDDLPPRRPGMMPENGRGSVFDNFRGMPTQRPGRMSEAGGRGHLPDEFDDGDGFSDYRNDRPGRSGGGRFGPRQPYGQSRY
ncbi:hypothetical protein LTS10_010803 [Elasticomyces elasticus]|nr:hypothetical protein LTS10_010803 [Elasticomyces elasticus]